MARATANLCGKFEISGGHLGWAAVWQLLLGRSTELALDNVRITGADKKLVLAAERLEATLEVHVRPVRLILSNVLMVRGFDISVGSLMSLVVVLASFIIADAMGPGAILAVVGNWPGDLDV